MAIYALDGMRPDIADSCFVAPDATVIGNVVVGAESSVWPHASVRGDSDQIRIGERCSVQDGAVLHTADGSPAVVGDGVTMGHQAVVHGCRVGDDCLIGMNATVLSGAEVGDGCIVAAGALVPEGREIPDRSVVMGVPGEVVRDVTDDDLARIRENAKIYVDKAERYRAGCRRVDRSADSH